MPDVNAPSLDRLLAGELSHADQRRLAREALDDPELFDVLMAAALTKAALETPAVAEVPPRVAGWRQRPRAAILAMAAAAAAVILAVAYGWARWSTVPAAPAAAPVAVAPPILLTARGATASGQTFRTEAAAARSPKTTGVVVSVREGVAEVDIGALDGLKQEMNLRVVRGGRPAGSMTTDAVFRERARGRVRGGDVRPGDNVEIDPAITASALIEQAHARRAAGDTTGARELAARAASLGDAASIPPDIRRRTLTELGKLTREQGNLAEAARLFQQALDTFTAASPAERNELRTGSGELLNELGAVQIERRDLASAERSLQSAQAVAAGDTRMRVANNLGALAALRGDLAAAEGLYRRAASLAGDSPDLAADRRAIEQNLTALRLAR